MNKTEFTGDVFLEGEGGVGDLVVENGLVQDCRDFSTSVYLSLFGGNAEDDAGRDTETWWGNLIPGTMENEKMFSSFYAITSGLPLNSGNIKKAVAAAERDLHWMIKEGIADDIEATISAENIKQIHLTVRVSKEGKNVFKDTYSFQWQGAMNGIRK